MPPEIRNNMLGRFSAMGAANDRDGIYSPKVIEEFAAFCILALKHPQTGDTRHLPRHFSSVTSNGRLRRYSGITRHVTILRRHLPRHYFRGSVSFYTDTSIGLSRIVARWDTGIHPACGEKFRKCKN
jgi:hypothetical protein